MKKLAFLLLTLGAFIPASAAPPAHTHRHPYHITPVSWIVKTRNKLSVDDRYVTIIGHVTRRITGDEYWFTDGTGSVRLDSENFDLPIGRRIVIGGRIDQAYLGIGHLEVDVRNWHYPPVRHAVIKTTTVTTKPAPAASATAPAAAATPPPAPESAPAVSTPTTPPPAPVSQPAETTAAPASTNQAATSPLVPPAESH